MDRCCLVTLLTGVIVVGLFAAISMTAGGCAWAGQAALEFGDDFDHPRLPAGHPQRRHVLYRITPS